MKKCLMALFGLFSAPALAQQGQWEQPFDFGLSINDRIVAVHLVHVYDGFTGKAVAVPQTQQACGGFQASSNFARLWTFPTNGSTGPGGFEAAPLCRTWMFCGGHSALADGRILFIGGMASDSFPIVGVNHANLFYPLAPPGLHWNTGLTLTNMNSARWYPTATTLGDGKVFAHSGLIQGTTIALTPEIYDPSTDMWNAIGSAAPENEVLYPWMFVLPNGNLFKAGWGPARILDTASWTWHSQSVPGPSWPDPPPPAPGEHGSAVMYEPGKIMICGGNDPAEASTYVIDFTQVLGERPAWKVAGNMNIARLDHNLVILPDGKILALGGARYKDVTPDPLPTCAPPQPTTCKPVYEPEIFDPASGTWEQQPPAAIPRMYHSTAMLLRDGRVVSAGGDARLRSGSATGAAGASELGAISHRVQIESPRTSQWQHRATRLLHAFRLE